MPGIYGGVQGAQGRDMEIRQRAMQIQEGEQRLMAAKRQLMAEAAALQGLGDQPQQQPQQSMQMQPQQQQMPMQRPMPQGGMPSQNAPQVNSGGQGMPGVGTPPTLTPGGAPPAPGAPGASGRPFGGGVQNVQDPMTVLKSIAGRIKQANPNAPPDVLFGAVAKTVALMRGLDSETKTALNAEIQIQRIQQQADAAVMRANSAAEVAQIRADSTNQMSSIRLEIAKLYEGGRNTRLETTEAGRNTRLETTEAGKSERQERGIEARSALRTQIDGAIDARAGAKKSEAAAYKKLAADRQAIKDEVQIAQNAQDQDAVDKLKPRLQAADRAISDYWSKNQFLPRPSELDRLKAPAEGGAPRPATPPVPAKPGEKRSKAGTSVEVQLPKELPADLPDPKSYKDGDVLVDESGNDVAKLVSGKWQSP